MIEVAIENVKVIVAGACAVCFEIMPIQMIVVDKAAIKNNAAVRL